MVSGRRGSTAARAPWAIALAAIGFFVWNIARYFPNAAGGLGYDYGLFLPWFTGGYFWTAVNGVMVPPDYLPSFCGGVPFLFNPQSVFWSLPQALMQVMPPLESLMVSWWVFGLLGWAGMYGLLRRIFGTSSAAALVGATLFLLNGFYTSRMIIGHVTFHGVMLLPLIAWLLLARPDGSRKQWASFVARGVSAALLLAYLFYSGGTNTILPMGLALLVLGLLAAHGGRWHRGIVPVVAMALLLWIALCAYKLLPALAFAANVERPVSLRMTSDLLALVGAASMSLFAPQVLAWLPSEKLVLDRVEFEYGVGMVPLLVLGAATWVAMRRRDLGHLFAGHRFWLVMPIVLLLTVPILLNWDALGLRWLVLHLPVLKMMSVMVRYWFVYVPLLCVLTALLLDYLLPDPERRAWWAVGAMALTITQSAATDMRYYAAQSYDPAPLIAARARVAAGGAVPNVERIADPWLVDGRVQPGGSTRNDAMADGISPYPCYEPMFGYRMEVFRQGRLDTGPVLAVKDGRLNLKNPACYVFPQENRCRPGDEFTAGQRREAEAFSHYRPFAHVWPARQYVATAISWAALMLSLIGLVASAIYLWIARRNRQRFLRKLPPPAAESFPYRHRSRP